MKQICSFCWVSFQPEMLLQMVWKNILAQPDFRGIAGSTSSLQEVMHFLLGGGAWGIWHFAHASELNGNSTKGTDLQALHRADVRTLHDLVSPFEKAPVLTRVQRSAFIQQNSLEKNKPVKRFLTEF